MTTDPSDGVDGLLRRLPAAAWRSLAPLVVAGVSTGAAWGTASWMFGSAPLVGVIVAAVSVVPVTWAVTTLNGELFDRERPSLARRSVVVLVFSLAPCLFAAWSGFTAAVAEPARALLLQIVAVAAVVAAVLAALVGVVAVAVGSVRDDVRVPTVALVALLATLRRPIAPVSALLAGGAVAWLGLTWFSGFVFLAAPVLIVLAVPAGWYAASAFGVSLPPLAPLRPLRARAVKGTT